MEGWVLIVVAVVVVVGLLALVTFIGGSSENEMMQGAANSTKEWFEGFGCTR